MPPFFSNDLIIAAMTPLKLSASVSIEIEVIALQPSRSHRTVSGIKSILSTRALIALPVKIFTLLVKFEFYLEYSAMLCA
jgi:hypothetical protein